MQIDIDFEQVGRLVYADLEDTRNSFMNDLEKDYTGVFDINPVYDKAIILEHIRALDLILDWYREP